MVAEAMAQAVGQPGGGGLGGLGGAGQGQGQGQGEGQGEDEEEAVVGDSSRDSWFRPKSVYDDNNITVYAYFEDENRKFNLLSLVSPDEEFAKLSRARLVRLLDSLWEDTKDFDLSGGDAEQWADAIRDWMLGAQSHR